MPMMQWFAICKEESMTAVRIPVEYVTLIFPQILLGYVWISPLSLNYGLNITANMPHQS